LEEYAPGSQFDLATMRMVVEHVTDPEAFVGALSRFVRPGGLAVVFTVDLWAPITVLSRVIPFRFHHPIKRLFWSGEAEDTFPVQYRMNTRATLRRLFTGAGFSEEMFASVDDLSLFSRYRVMNYAELTAWRGLRRWCGRGISRGRIGIGGGWGGRTSSFMNCTWERLRHRELSRRSSRG
jgi:SAM-dependent methyltransferase